MRPSTRAVTSPRADGAAAAGTLRPVHAARCPHARCSHERITRPYPVFDRSAGKACSSSARHDRAPSAALLKRRPPRDPRGPQPAGAHRRLFRERRKPLRGEAAFCAHDGCTTGMRRPKARRMHAHAASYSEAFPTSLRWHYPDQVQRDKGADRLISARKGAPSGFILTIRKYPVSVNQYQSCRLRSAWRGSHDWAQVFHFPSVWLLNSSNLLKIFVSVIHLEFSGTVQNERHARTWLLALGFELTPKFFKMFK